LLMDKLKQPVQSQKAHFAGLAGSNEKHIHCKAFHLVGQVT